jgi:predicted MFS family arabinose efflux permease
MTRAAAAPPPPDDPAPASDQPSGAAPAHGPGGVRVALTVFLPFAAGYFLSYLYRTVNAVIADDLAAAAGVHAGGLGLLTSAYFVAFAAFQLPLGLLLDRYGPRRVESALLAVAAAGALLFSFGNGLAVLTVGRALIGLGVSACLMAAFQNNVLWWPARRLPLVNGLVLACGGLGALFATTPVAALLEVTDWRGVFRLLAALTLAVAVWLYLTVPDRPAAAREGLGAQLRGLARIGTSAVFWRVAPMTLVAQATFMAYQGLWAGPWLAEVDGLARGAVAVHLQSIAIGMIVGYGLIGVVTERLDRLGIPPARVLAALVGGFLVVQAALLVPGLAAPAVLWPLFGLLGTAAILSYAIVSQAFPVALAGRANTALNLLVFVAAFAAQAGIGAVIDALPPEAGFGAAGHRVALAVMLALGTAGYVWFLWPRRR